MMNQHKLSTNCKHSLFEIKKSELTDSKTDFTLMNACKGALQQFCQDIDERDSLKCLKLHKDEPLFDRKCHLIVVNRLILMNQDYRFNSELQQSCSKNIAEFCLKVVAEGKENEELNGLVINCLKKRFSELLPKCKKSLTQILRDQALNYKLNPLLATLCKSEIEILCSSGEDEDSDEEGKVEECLKKQFLAKRIITKECKIEVATLIQESKADIHVDPILLKSCTVDLLKYCSNVDSGNGRRKTLIAKS